jgi:NADH-quinone oxidoreductase subunit E/NADP-reducing hydrogenase subunit HndA
MSCLIVTCILILLDFGYEFKRILGIEVGETTPDGKFSLDCLRCVGACGLAPVAVIGERTYGRVTADMIKNILKEYE